MVVRQLRFVCEAMSKYFIDRAVNGSWVTTAQTD
jgi:hypothetical protein